MTDTTPDPRGHFHDAGECRALADHHHRLAALAATGSRARTHHAELARGWECLRNIGGGHAVVLSRPHPLGRWHEPALHDAAAAATLIVRDASESDRADPDHRDTICISVGTLTAIAERRTTTAPIADPAADVGLVAAARAVARARSGTAREAVAMAQLLRELDRIDAAAADPAPTSIADPALAIAAGRCRACHCWACCCPGRGPQ